MDNKSDSMKLHYWLHNAFQCTLGTYIFILIDDDADSSHREFLMNSANWNLYN